MRRPQFSIGALLIAMLAAACFFGGVHFEQRRKQHDAAARGVQTVDVRLANEFSDRRTVDYLAEQNGGMMEAPW